MTTLSSPGRTRLALAFALTLLPVAALSPQQRLLLPEGTVITVQTQAPLSSQTARQGDVFRTAVMDSVRVEGFTVIPEGSIIDGRITLVRRADRRQSGVLGVEFTRLELPNGSATAIDGKLTSTDPGERRQIDAQPGAQVLFVGGRRGAGAAIGAINTGSADDPFTNVLGALGSLLSEGADVTVPQGSRLGVQLERGIALRVVGSTPQRRPDAFSIYTSAEAIRQAQDALRQRGYYRGTSDGVLGEGTQRALVEFQIDEGIIVTGNLDGRTASALGLNLTARGAGFSPGEASLLRRNAQIVVARYREAVGITSAGRLDSRRFYDSGELELFFALSAFADNAGLFEQMVRLSGNVEGIEAAETALVHAARRVDEAMRQEKAPTRVATAWGAIQEDLTELDPGYLRR